MPQNIIAQAQCFLHRDGHTLNSFLTSWAYLHLAGRRRGVWPSSDGGYEGWVASVGDDTTRLSSHLGDRRRGVAELV